MQIAYALTRQGGRSETKSGIIYDYAPSSFHYHGSRRHPALFGHAQTSHVACEPQQSLEQALTSDGDIMPDDCRTISVERLSRDGRDLCLVDLSEADGGLISDLREVAVPAKWWFGCDELMELAAPPQ